MLTIKGTVTILCSTSVFLASTKLSHIEGVKAGRLLQLVVYNTIKPIEAIRNLAFPSIEKIPLYLHCLW